MGSFGIDILAEFEVNRCLKDKKDNVTMRLRERKRERVCVCVRERKMNFYKK